MGFRTVVVNSRCKLEFRLNYLIARGETEKRIYINEINTLIVQSTAVSLTAALLSELVRNNVKVIFCDEKCNPTAELQPYYGAHNTAKRVKNQIRWSDEVKGEVWQKLIRKKLANQSESLLRLGYDAEAKLINEYAEDVTVGDVTNREGHAAKVYFNRILPDSATRRCDVFMNGCLNYGYAVLLSAINREVVASGYITQLGIWHDNEFNQFNLSSDLIEPLRYIVDETALRIETGDAEFKKKMINILNLPTVFDGKNTTLDIAVRQYVKSALYALDNRDTSAIKFPQNVEFANE